MLRRKVSFDWKLDSNMVVNENETSLNKSSRLEVFAMEKLEDNKFAIAYRNIAMKTTKMSYVTGKYFPILCTEIMDKIKEQEYWAWVESYVQKTIFDDRGFLYIRFTPISSNITIPIVKRSGSMFTIVGRQPLNEFSPEVKIVNSVDKTHALKMVEGFVQLSTGMCFYSAFGANTKKVKHYNWNKEKIHDSVDVLIKELPRCSNDSVINDLNNFVLTDEIKKEFLDKLHVWKVKKEEGKMWEKNQNYRDIVKAIENVFISEMNKLESLLDFVCLVSEFKVSRYNSSQWEALTPQVEEIMGDVLDRLS